MSLKNYIGKDKLFEGAIIINLDSRQDRWVQVQSELNKLDIQDTVERLPGIIHHYGMVGCSLSHLECVKIAKQKGWKSVLIFEDDIVVTKDFESCYKKSLDQLSKHKWGVFHFGAMLMGVCDQIDNNLLAIGQNWAAHALAIHEDLYDFIIDTYDWSYSETDSSKPWGGHYPFDGFINNQVYIKGFKIFSAYPVLITQRPNFSDTWGYHRDYNDLIETSYKTQLVRECNVLVFSKNRPIQLHATLSTFFKYIKDGNKVCVKVLYTCSSQYVDAYNTLIQEFKDRVVFIKESNFLNDTLQIIQQKRYIMFIVDDTVFHRPFYVSDGCEELSRDNDILSFSYRLGSNISYSYINNVPYDKPTEYNSTSNIVRIDWTTKLCWSDFGYPFEISSSLYRSSDIQKMISWCGIGWDNPNYFELTGTTVVRNNKESYGKYISTYRKSTAVSVPLNRVQHLHLNRCGTNPLYVPESLLSYFEMGKALNFDNINENWTTNSVHVELTPGFKPR